MDGQGRVRRAPENFLNPSQIAEVQAGRRDFLRGAFAAAAAATWAPACAGATGTAPAYAGATGTAAAVTPAKAGAQVLGDPAILNLPEHSKGLGQPVVARAYGLPS